MKWNFVRNKNLLPWLLAGFFVLGILLKLWLWHQASFVSRDSIFYLRQIKALHESGAGDYYRNNPDAYYPPLLFWAAGGLMHLGLNELRAGLTLNILLGACIPVAGYFLLFEITGRKEISLLGAFFLLLHPKLHELSLQIQRDAGYLLFCTLVMWMMCRAVKQKSARNWCLAALFSVGAFGFRVEALEFLPLVMVVLAVMLWRKDLSRQKAAWHFSCFAAAAVLAFSAMFCTLGLNCHAAQKIYVRYFAGPSDNPASNPD